MAQFPPIRITIAAIDRFSANMKKFETRTSGVRAGVARLSRFAAIGAAGMLSLGTAAAYAGSRLVTGFIDKASGLVNAADRIGITAERMQELTFVADQFGVSQGQLEVGLKKFVKEVGPVDENLGLFADRLAAVSDESTRAKILVKAFGRTGQSLGPMFRDGARGVAAQVAEFRALGSLQSEDTLRRAEELGAAFARIKGALGGVVGAGFTALLPQFEQMAAAAEAWLRLPANRQQITSFFRDIGDAMGKIANRDTLADLASVARAFASAGAFVVRDVPAFLNAAVAPPRNFDEWGGPLAPIIRNAPGGGMVERAITRIIIEPAPGTDARLAPGSQMAPGMLIRNTMGPIGVGGYRGN